jgi:adenosine deaminase
VRLTVNSDDPALFNTTLQDEVATLSRAFGFTESGADVRAVDEILLGGICHSFLPPAQKAALEGASRARLDALKDEHLPSPTASTAPTASTETEKEEQT